MAVVTFMVVPVAGPHTWPPLAPTPTPRGCPWCSPPRCWSPHTSPHSRCHCWMSHLSPRPVPIAHPHPGPKHAASQGTHGGHTHGPQGLPRVSVPSRGDTATGASPPQQGQARAVAPRPIPGPRPWQSQRKLFLSLLPPHPLPFFSSPRVSNSFSSPIMRGLQGKLQQDAFVGRQSERGRQRGALCARGPPGPPGAGGTFRAITCPESNCQSFLEGKASN